MSNLQIRLQKFTDFTKKMLEKTGLVESELSINGNTKNCQI